MMNKYDVFPLYFKHARAGQLAIPDDLTQEDFELLQMQISNSLEIIETVLLVERKVQPSGAGLGEPSDSQE